MYRRVNKATARINYCLRDRVNYTTNESDTTELSNVEKPVEEKTLPDSKLNIKI